MVLPHKASLHPTWSGSLNQSRPIRSLCKIAPDPAHRPPQTPKKTCPPLAAPTQHVFFLHTILDDLVPLNFSAWLSSYAAPFRFSLPANLPAVTPLYRRISFTSQAVRYFRPALATFRFRINRN